LQLLGQQLLELELYRIAVERFEAIPVTASGVVLGRGYAAWARWRLGQKDAAIAQLRELQAFASQQPFVATLYATMMIDRGALDEADVALNAVEAAHPLDPAIMLVRADVLAARRDYAAAVAERRRAFDLAPPAARGRYALALAELHLSLTYQPCDGGVTAARTATSLASNDPAAWHMLAALLYHCRQYVEAADAARRGLDVEPGNAALEFFLGAALWNNNQRRSGRVHLQKAADLAPSSEWRRRSEDLLLM
jgi:predicted Zn-dependent protease